MNWPVGTGPWFQGVFDLRSNEVLRFERTHHNVRKTGHRIDPQALTLRVREAMKQPASYQPAWQAALAYSPPERLELPVLRMAARDDVFAHLSPDALPVADNAASRAAAIAGWKP